MMKVAVIFVLLFATVLCRPAGKVPDVSSESSEEVARQPAAVAPQVRAAAPVTYYVPAAAAGSDESSESSDEDEQAAAEAPAEAKSDSTDSTNSEDSDDDDETEESETEEDESSDSSESGESSTLAPVTATPMVVTEEPMGETTPEPIVPTIVTDARGDNLGGYPSDYKTIIYVEDKSYHKSAPYKSYEFVGTGKKMAYDMTDGNEVEKSLQVYKALQVHSDLLEEDTSTPEVESQGLDAPSATSEDQDVSLRKAALPEEEESASTASTSTASDSDSASASQESEDEESEEATATPGASDSESDESDSNESDSDEKGAGPDTTTDMPVVITAK